MGTAPHTTRTRTSPDGMYAPSKFGNGQKLAICICNACEREVVWATSRRTGGRYLANVEHKPGSGARVYNPASLHRCS